MTVGTMKAEKVSLSNLAGGAAVELFDEELRKVIENILDPNTEATAKRSITLKVAVKPSSDRDMGGVTIEASSALAPYGGTSTAIYVGKKGDEVVAYEYNPRQMKLFVAQDKTSPPVTTQPTIVTAPDTIEAGMPSPRGPNALQKVERPEVQPKRT